MSYLCISGPATAGESPLSHSLAEAEALFRRFHRFPPSAFVTRWCERRIPRVLVRLGRLEGLIYSSERGRPGCPRSFVHFMKNPPLLACDPGGRRLFVLGGNYRVTPFGIEG